MAEELTRGEELKKVVFDTTALIFLSDFTPFEKIYTVDDVVEEVKDRLTSMKLSAVLKKMKVVEPDKASIEDVKAIAKETGDFAKLSDTDVKVIALAKQLDCTIISDDYNIQNVAGHLGIAYVSVFNPAIKKLKKWRK